jgi:hypothetical protein
MSRLGKIVRKKDSLGRRYYWDRENKKRVKKDAWERERERVREETKSRPPKGQAPGQAPAPDLPSGPSARPPRIESEIEAPEDLEEPPPDVDVPEEIEVFDVDVEGYESA